VTTALECRIWLEGGVGISDNNECLEEAMVGEGICGAKGGGLLLLRDNKIMTMDNVCKDGDEADEASLSDGTTLVVADEVRLILVR
jgi:hypothetical protein